MKTLIAVLTLLAIATAATANPPSLGRPEQPFAPSAADKSLGTEMLFAVVVSDGTLAVGNAVSSTRTSAGQYQLAFNRPIDACTRVVSAGNAPNTLTIVAILSSRVSPSTRTVANISSYNPSDGSPMDANFHLMIFCSG